MAAANPIHYTENPAEFMLASEFIDKYTANPDDVNAFILRELEQSDLPVYPNDGTNNSFHFYIRMPRDIDTVDGGIYLNFTIYVDHYIKNALHQTLTLHATRPGRHGLHITLHPRAVHANSQTGIRVLTHSCTFLYGIDYDKLANLQILDRPMTHHHRGRMISDQEFLDMFINPIKFAMDDDGIDITNLAGSNISADFDRFMLQVITRLRVLMFRLINRFFTIIETTAATAMVGRQLTTTIGGASNINDKYYSKYLKYKQKYLELKNKA